LNRLVGSGKIPLQESWRYLQKRLSIDADLYTILQILSLIMCEKIILNQMVTYIDHDLSNLETNNHLNLFD